MVKDRNDNIWWTQKERPKSTIPFSHLAKVNECRETQAIKAAKARQAKNYLSPILTLRLVQQWVAIFLFKYQILILIPNKVVIYGIAKGYAQIVAN